MVSSAVTIERANTGHSVSGLQRRTMRARAEGSRDPPSRCPALGAQRAAEGTGGWARDGGGDPRGAPGLTYAAAHRPRSARTKAGAPAGRALQDGRRRGLRPPLGPPRPGPPRAGASAASPAAPRPPEQRADVPRASEGGPAPETEEGPPDLEPPPPPALWPRGSRPSPRARAPHSAPQASARPERELRPRPPVHCARLAARGPERAPSLGATWGAPGARPRPPRLSPPLPPPAAAGVPDGAPLLPLRLPPSGQLAGTRALAPPPAPRAARAPERAPDPAGPRPLPAGPPPPGPALPRAPRRAAPRCAFSRLPLCPGPVLSSQVTAQVCQWPAAAGRREPPSPSAGRGSPECMGAGRAALGA
ncbi:basic proline-rich protein-like [Phocoena phocoena]|uniref:basic proline-rich protein-like n=1 Tax=Phocoena phocoena TaxID=9742 RepID=UPI003306E709